MKIPFTQPYKFEAKDMLAPEDINEVFDYAGSCLKEASSRRWQHGLLVLQFVEDINTPLTQAMSVGERSIRFTCPNTCIIERAVLTANMTSDRAVEVNITVASSGLSPDGATVPWLTSDGGISSAATVVSDTAPDRVLLVAGTEYLIAVSIASGNFSLGRFDITLNTLVDRWTPAGTIAEPSFASLSLTDASAVNATTINNANTSLSTEVAKLAANVVAPTPMLISRCNILSGTSVNLRTFTIPRFGSTRAQCRIIKAYLRVELDSAGGVGQTVSATLKDAAGSTLTALSASMNGLTGLTVASGTLAHALAGAASETTTNDFSIVFANSSGVVNAAKVYVLLWLSR